MFARARNKYNAELSVKRKKWFADTLAREETKIERERFVVLCQRSSCERKAGFLSWVVFGVVAVVVVVVCVLGQC